MVVRSQHTSVDPRDGASRSYLLESHRNKGCFEVVQTSDNNQRRSMSKNMFNRLGREVDMRETLNRRGAKVLTTLNCSEGTNIN